VILDSVEEVLRGAPLSLLVVGNHEVLILQLSAKVWWFHSCNLPQTAKNLGKSSVGMIPSGISRNHNLSKLATVWGDVSSSKNTKRRK